MTIERPTPRVAESFIGNSNKPTWKQLKCIFALNNGKPYNKPKTREEASQMIQHLKSGSKLGTGKSGFQLLSDLAELKSEVKAKIPEVEIESKIVELCNTKTTKITRATLRQKMCIYAISMNLWNDKQKAKDLSNLAKTREQASATIQQLKELQN